MSVGFVLDKLFFLAVIFVVAVAPFIAIWRLPATLLTKSLATVVALLFFTMALMFIQNCVEKSYADHFFFPSLHEIGTKLSDEAINPADVSTVIRKWQSSVQGYHVLRDALQDLQPPDPTESTEQPAEPQQETTTPPPAATEPAPAPTPTPAEEK